MFARMIAFLVVFCLSMFGQQAYSEPQANSPSVIRYAEITPSSIEEVAELLTRVSEYALSEDLFDAPIVIMLHGPEAAVFVGGGGNRGLDGELLAVRSHRGQASRRPEVGVGSLTLGQ